PIGRLGVIRFLGHLLAPRDFICHFICPIKFTLTAEVGFYMSAIKRRTVLRRWCRKVPALMELLQYTLSPDLPLMGDTG
ncbi:hypothetical protein C4E44_30480, partial [Pseudomonas sp. MWU12-2312b]